ncbi:MAG: hypothetical protein IJR18_06815 [Campylobacter sp.]|nr:hypothetical protein [Campylobacter sp.]
MDYSKENNIDMISNNYKIYHNPTRGIIADLVESSVDFVGGSSGLSKQIGYEIKNNPNNNYIALSQGTLLVNSGKKIYGFNDDNVIYIGTPLYRTFGKNTINNPNDPVHAPHIILSPKTWEYGNPFYYQHVKAYGGVGNLFQGNEK